jgi:hypothetical protein
LVNEKKYESRTNEFLNNYLSFFRKIIFPEHVPVSEIQRGIKSGKYLQGTFQASRENYLEANVFIQDSEKYTQVKEQNINELVFIKKCSFDLAVCSRLSKFKSCCS